MIAEGDEKELLSLKFATSDDKLHNDLTFPLQSIEEELSQYFLGDLKSFKTKLHIDGTTFQKKTWQRLLCIPYGQTQSYGQLAKAVGNPKAYRAVAQANNRNKFALIIPCHRVIYNDGTIGGYAYGIELKKQLLRHEESFRELS